jgi:hypothetical protein
MTLFKKKYYKYAIYYITLYKLYKGNNTEQHGNESFLEKLRYAD